MKVASNVPFSVRAIFFGLSLIYVTCMFNCVAHGIDQPTPDQLNKVDIKIVSPTSDTISNPLPVLLEGMVENFTSIDTIIRSKTHLYVVQKSQGEIIYHIQPEFILSSDGKFKGQAWLGSKRFGNGEAFEIVFILTTQKIPLQAGDNPVTDVPVSYYSKKFVITRSD